MMPKPLLSLASTSFPDWSPSAKQASFSNYLHPSFIIEGPVVLNSWRSGREGLFKKKNNCSGESTESPAMESGYEFLNRVCAYNSDLPVYWLKIDRTGGNTMPLDG